MRAQQKVNPFMSKMKPSKVVLISNLDNIFKHAKEVFAFFSCFGNIRKVLLMKNLNKAMVEYFQIDSSLLCALNVNNLKIQNTELRINYSKHSTIDLEKNNKNLNSVSYNEIFIPGNEDHRYQKEDFVGNISKNLKAKITLEEAGDLEVLKEKVREFLGGKESSLMLENRQEKYVEIRVVFEDV